MEWKSLLIGFIIGALIAVPLGMAHTGVFNSSVGRGFGPMMSGMHMGMMNDHDEMGNYMTGDNLTQMHDEMEPIMEKYMGSGWKGMHEYCEKNMGIDDEDDE